MVLICQVGIIKLLRQKIISGLKNFTDTFNSLRIVTGTEEMLNKCDPHTHPTVDKAYRLCSTNLELIREEKSTSFPHGQSPL